jgi:hypothetical protein
MINLNKSLEHPNPNRQGLDIEKYSLGWFDGLTGSDPEEIENDSYWHGYCLGRREYLFSKRGIELLIAA